MLLLFPNQKISLSAPSYFFFFIKISWLQAVTSPPLSPDHLSTGKHFYQTQKFLPRSIAMSVNVKRKKRTISIYFPIISYISRSMPKTNRIEIAQKVLILPFKGTSNRLLSYFVGFFPSHISFPFTHETCNIWLSFATCRLLLSCYQWYWKLLHKCVRHEYDISVFRVFFFIVPHAFTYYLVVYGFCFRTLPPRAHILPSSRIDNIPPLHNKTSAKNKKNTRNIQYMYVAFLHKQRQFVLIYISSFSLALIHFLCGQYSGVVLFFLSAFPRNCAFCVQLWI